MFSSLQARCDGRPDHKRVNSCIDATSSSSHQQSGPGLVDVCSGTYRHLVMVTVLVIILVSILVSILVMVLVVILVRMTMMTIGAAHGSKGPTQEHGSNQNADSVCRENPDAQKLEVGAFQAP